MGANLFGYVGNSPICNSDFNGYIAANIIISCIINKRKFSLLDLLIDIAFGLVWGYLGSNGVGYGYWQKNLFSKGGYFSYGGKVITRDLRLIKPVIKDFVKGFGIYWHTARRLATKICKGES